MQKKNILSLRRHSDNMRKGRALALAVAGVGGLCNRSAHAASDAWSTAPASANFSGTNWTTGTTTPGAATGTAASSDGLYFGNSTLLGNSTSLTLNNDDTGFTFAGLVFNAGATTAYTIGGNSFTLTGGISNLSATAHTINVPITLNGNQSFAANTIAGTLTLGGNITGAGLVLTTNGTTAKDTASNIVFTGSVSVAALVAQGNANNDSNYANNATTTFNNATLTTTGNVSIGRSNLVFGGTTVANIGGSLNNAATTNDWASLTIQGSANVTATSVNMAVSTSTGQFNLLGGTLKTGSIAAIDSTNVTNNVHNVLNGTQIIASGNNTSFLTITLSSINQGGSSEVFVGSNGALFNTNGFNIGTSVALKNDSTAGTLVKSGNGTLTLSGASSYSGLTTISAGTLSTGAAGTLGNGTVASSIGNSTNLAGNLVLNGGTLQYANTGAAESTDRLFTLGASGGALDASGANLISFTNTGNIAFSTPSATSALTLTGTGNGSLAAVIGDSGTGGNTTSILKSGAGTWTLAGADSYSGTTTASAGTINITGTNSGNGSLVLSGGTINVNSSGNVTVSAITGSSGTLKLTGGTLLESSNANVTGSGTLNFAGGTLQSAAPLTITNFPNVLFTGAATVDTTGGNITINPGIANNGSSGSGTFTVQGGHTLLASLLPGRGWTGNTVVTGNGTIFVDAFAGTESGSLTVNTGATYDMDNVSTGWGGLNGNGTIVNSGANAVRTLTIAGTGGGNFTGTIAPASTPADTAVNIQLTSGTQTFSGLSTYSGPTTISGGTLAAGMSSVAGTSGALGNNSAVTIANVSGAALAVNSGINLQIGSLSGGGTTGGNVTLATGATLTDVQTTATTFAGIISGNGGMILAGAGGNFTLTAANTYLGATTISAGTLTVSGAGSINGSSGITINGSGATYVQNSSVAGNLSISVTQGTLNGTGTVGNVTVSSLAGNTVTNAIGSGSGVLTVNNTLAFGGNSTLGVFVPGGNTTAAGIATTTLTTANTGLGEITVNVTPTSAWALGTNTYNLVSFTGVTGNVSDFTKGAIGGLTARESATLGLSGNDLTLTVAADAPEWTGLQNGNWTTNTIGGLSNWKLITAGTATDYISGDVVLFDDTASNGNVSMSSANVTPTSTTFNNSSLAYTLSSTGNFSVGGTGSLTKNGTALLTINTADTYSGGTIVNAGTMTIGTGGALGATTGTLAVNNPNVGAGTSVLLNLSTTSPTTTGSLSGTIAAPSSGTNTATINNGGQLFTVNQTAPAIFAGTIAGTGGFALGSLSTSSLTLAGQSTYSGPTTIAGGTLTAGVASVVSSGNATSGAFGVKSAVSLANVSGATLNLNNFSQQIGSLAGGGGTGGAVTLGNATLTTGEDGTSTTYSGSISGTGGLTKIGIGTQVLAAAYSYTGGTTVNGGTLQLNSINNTAATVTVNSGGILALNTASALGNLGTFVNVPTINSGGTISNITTASAVGLWNGLTMTGGNLTGTGAGDPNNGAYTLSGPVNATSDAAGNAALIGGTGNISLQNHNTSGNVIFNVTRGVASPASDLTVSANLAPFIYNGSINGITKTGNGTMALTAINSTYTGGTIISAGTLRANNTSGSATGTGNITVAASTTSGNYTGGILGGNGTVTGTVTLAGNSTAKLGGVIAAGADSNTIGTLTTGKETWNGGAAYQWKINAPGTGITLGNRTNVTGTAGTGYDLLQIGGNLTSGALLSVQPTGSTAFTIDPIGNITVTVGTTYNWTIAQIGSGNATQITLNGNATPTSSSTTPLSSSVFALDTSSLSINASNSSYLSDPGNFGLYFETVGANNDLVLSYDATPEPGTTLLVLGGAVPMLMGRRRRRAAKSEV